MSAALKWHLTTDCQKSLSVGTKKRRWDEMSTEKTQQNLKHISLFTYRLQLQEDSTFTLQMKLHLASRVQFLDTVITMVVSERTEIKEKGQKRIFINTHDV